VDFNELNTHLCFNKPRADLQMTYCQNKSVALIALYFFFCWRRLFRQWSLIWVQDSQQMNYRESKIDRLISMQFSMNKKGGAMIV